MQILRVRMDQLSASREDIDEEYQDWGGRGFIAWVLNREVDPACEPLGPGNKLILANGLLAGTGASSTGRLSIGGKSPLTGGIKESNVGGPAGDALARLGLRAIIVEGMPKRGAWFVLRVKPDGAELVPAEEYLGLGTCSLAGKLRERFGRGSAIVCIGPAGEQRLAAAGVAATDLDGFPARYAGRGGMGALMGSRGLKAIVIEGGRGVVPVHDTDAFRAAQKEFTAALLDHPMTGKAFPELGTTLSLRTVRAYGALPVRNFSRGDVEGEGAELLGEAIREKIVGRGGEGNPTHACMPGCVIRCSNVFPDAQGKAIVRALEYESIALLGPNLGIESIDQIARLNALCNDAGLDTMETGVAIGVAMEAGVVAFGDFEGAAGLIREAALGTVLGRVIGQGAAVAGRVLGVDRVPTVKGQGISAYDPRAIKGQGVTYCTTAMGADHGAGYVVYARVNHHLPERQVEVSRANQIVRATQDCLGLCSFALIAMHDRIPLLVDLVNAVLGTRWGPEWWQENGKSVLRLERRFNRGAGFTRAHDRLPEFMRTEPLPPFDLVFDVPQEEIDHIFDDLEP